MSRKRRERRERMRAAMLAASQAADPPAAIEALPALDVPLLVARVEREQQREGMSYEEANWDKLSPRFREAHNRLLHARGLPTIPPPKVDNYKPPPKIVRATDMRDPEVKAAIAGAVAVERSAGMMLRGGEGFEDRGLGHGGWLDP